MIWIKPIKPPMNRKPRTGRHSWAYTWNAPVRGYKRVKHSPEAWAKSKLSRDIRRLDERIAAGKGWLLTIPTTDPRYSKWSCAVALMRLERARLIAQAE